MAVTITLADLTPFAPALASDKADIMIADALALAAQVAPCIKDDDLSDEKSGAIKAILRGAILRWNDQGTGEQAALTAGIFGFNPKGNQRTSLLFPSEINDLAKICAGDTGAGRKAYMVDTLSDDEDLVEGS